MQVIDFFAVVFLESRIFVLNFARISHVKSQTNQIYSPATIFMEKVIGQLLTQMISFLLRSFCAQACARRVRRIQCFCM